MAMGTAPLKDLLALTDINRETLKSDRLRGYSVAAFGLARPIIDARCLLVDGIALLIHNSLSGKLHRRAAALVVRGFWDKWAEALSRIEHRHEPMLFAVGKHSETVWWAGMGPAQKLPPFAAKQPPMEDLLMVNIARHKANMEQRAENLGIALTGPFILPPDDPRFIEWMTEFRKDRERRQDMFDPLHMKPPRAIEWMTEFRKDRERRHEMFDPLHMKPPRAPSAGLRKSVEEASWHQ